MKREETRIWRMRPGLLLAGLLMAASTPAISEIALGWQDAGNVASRSGSPVEGEQEVVIKRAALSLLDPRTYRASMHLAPARRVDLTAPADGVIRSVAVRPGQKAKQQMEACRLDDARAVLVQKRAKALLAAAEAERKAAEAKGDAGLVALADARRDAAVAEVEIANHDWERLVVRVPFEGDIERVYVVEGQFVRAGDRLATVLDGSRLTVEVPIERTGAAPGGVLPIRVEDMSVQARIEAIIPLAPQFDALRELTASPASAIVVVDNTAGTLSAGQTVYSDLVPQFPVALVPSACISNLPDGNRKVQVLRDAVVRNVTVRVLGKIGSDSVYLSGRFGDGDEVIVSSTRELPDGTPLRALLGPAEQQGSGRAGSAKAAPGQPTGPSGKKPAVGF
jgi:membrane fusion protein, multidrug efflux system